MENINITETILDKKIESYRFNDKNFQASGEIMVTITLGEYRDLVERVATSENELNKANQIRREAEQKTDELEKAMQCLKDKIWGQTSEEVMEEEEL